MVLFAMIVWIIYAKMITNMAVIEYILWIKSQKKEQAFATYGIVGFNSFCVWKIKTFKTSKTPYVAIDERGLVRIIHLFLFSCVH